MWGKWIWNIFNVPKHSFVNWIIQLDKMKTKNNPKAIGVVDNAYCPVCGTAEEMKDHLYFECPV